MSRLDRWLVPVVIMDLLVSLGLIAAGRHREAIYLFVAALVCALLAVAVRGTKRSSDPLGISGVHLVVLFATGILCWAGAVVAVLRILRGADAFEAVGLIAFAGACAYLGFWATYAPIAIFVNHARGDRRTGP